MKRLIFHAGLPKTGSTALQVFLARNHAALRRQSFDYFELGEFREGSAGKISSGNGFAIARALLPECAPDAAEHFTALTRAIAASPCETGILSSEYFADADPAHLQSWAATLQASGMQVQMMYFIREQVQALSSMYVQYVKRSLCRETAEAYIERTYRATAYLKYARFHKSQRAIFGEGNVICRLYEAAPQSVTNVCESFLAAIGADAAGLPASPETVNPGLSPAELAIMRELNKYRPHTRLSDLLIENNRRAGQAPSGEIYNFLAPALMHEIEAYFAAENAEMAQLCFNRQHLFPAAAAGAAGTQVSIGEFSQTDLVNVLGGLLVRYDERLADLESKLGRSRLRPLKRLIRKLTPAALTASLSAFL